MASNKDFAAEDLVWAKMKGFPFWPGKIANPPSDAKLTSKKRQHYVFFFGSENYAWILDENIVHHSEEMLQSASKKKKSTVLKIAIEKITEEAAQKTESLVKEKEYPEVSASDTERRVTKNQGNEIGSLKVPKTASKRLAVESSSASPPYKTRHISPTSTELTNETFPNIDSGRVAFIKPAEHSHVTSSGIDQHSYHGLKPDPGFNVNEIHDKVRNKKVVPTNKKIGFIGLGMMGKRIVKNLLATKHKVTIWNRTADKCVEFAKIGASIAQTPGDVVEKCDITFCCVSGPEASKSLILGKCGILSALKKFPPRSKCYVEMTTMDPDSAVKIAKYVVGKGGRYLETPIIGSRQKADEGNLLILGGGDEKLFVDCESVFKAIAGNAYFMDRNVGNASKYYIIHSMLVGVSQAALRHGMALINRSNLGNVSFMDMLRKLPLSSSLISEKKNFMNKFNCVTNIPLKYQQRDLRMAVSLSDMCHQRLVVTSTTNEFFKRVKCLCYSDHDASW